MRGSIKCSCVGSGVSAASVRTIRRARSHSGDIVKQSVIAVSIENSRRTRMNTDVMFSSKTDDWATPQDFFDELNREFGFTLDPCADHVNHKCATYYTKEQDGLVRDWGGNEYFVILPMVKRLASGFKNLLRRVASPIPLS
jgi:hypothetical protein